MSLDYSTLKLQILADAHRPALGDAKAADFVRQAEGVIRRELRAAEMIVRVNLTDLDRVTVDEGFYTLPVDFLEDRTIYLVGTDCPLDRVSLKEIRQTVKTVPVCQYTIISKTEVEFRGVPSPAQSMELLYFGAPTTLANPTDDNAILIQHETIYLHGGLAALYEFTQDLELRDTAASTMADAIETLNEQAGRMLGGGTTSGGYNLSSFGSY